MWEYNSNSSSSGFRASMQTNKQTMIYATSYMSGLDSKAMRCGAARIQKTDKMYWRGLRHQRTGSLAWYFRASWPRFHHVCVYNVGKGNKTKRLTYTAPLRVRFQIAHAGRLVNYSRLDVCILIVLLLLSTSLYHIYLFITYIWWTSNSHQHSCDVHAATVTSIHQHIDITIATQYHCVGTP